ncbi:TPA: phage tail protein, partial [Providencia alcalifaciens]
APAGNVLTGLVIDETGSNSADNVSGAWYRPVQKLINGTWYNVSGV